MPAAVGKGTRGRVPVGKCADPGKKVQTVEAFAKILHTGNFRYLMAMIPRPFRAAGGVCEVWNDVSSTMNLDGKAITVFSV